MISDRICRSGSPRSQIVPQSQSLQLLLLSFHFPSRQESWSEDGAFCHILCKVKWIGRPSLADSTLSYCGRLLPVTSVWAFSGRQVYQAQVLPNLEKHNNTRQWSSSRLPRSCRWNTKWPSLGVTHLSLEQNRVNRLFSELSQKSWAETSGLILTVTW